MSKENTDFVCDTEDCIYWKDGVCTKETAITIQEHHCVDYEKAMTEYQYSLIAGLPRLLSTVYVTVSGGFFYQTRL